MGFVRRVPSSVGELEENVKKLHQNKSHISSVKVNESNSHIEVDLDWSANRLGGDAGKDFYLTIRPGKLREAKEVVDGMMKESSVPSTTDIRKLFDMIDQHGQ